MKQLILALLISFSFTLLTPTAAHAELKLPSYAAKGNVTSEIQSKGKNITNVISLVVGIISILGILVGTGFMGGGNPERGRVYMLGGVGGLIIASMVFGIAQLVVA
ncbi:MAG TPA: hypothetical protein ENK38_05530 [Gammaproteobacteria bacterium]|nr:hypothetical protein [Gammaproteobacteria bacterium]